MGSFIIPHWRGEISFVKSFWLVFMLGSGVLATAKSVLVEAFNQGVIPEALVWLFEGLCIPVFVWQVTCHLAKRAKRTELREAEVC